MALGRRCNQRSYNGCNGGNDVGTAKILNPEAHFDKPKHVAEDDALSHQEKKKALNNWEQDERQMLTASNEGMPGSDEGQRKKEANRLDEVVQAKDQIGEKPKHKSSH